MIWSTFAFGPQYFGFLTTTSFSPSVHDLNLNGPVPIGCCVANVPPGWKTPFASTEPLFAPYFFSAVGLMIAKFRRASPARNDADGCVSVMAALYLPAALQLLYRLVR